MGPSGNFYSHMDTVRSLLIFGTGFVCNDPHQIIQVLNKFNQV